MLCTITVQEGLVAFLQASRN